ncbi:MAG TPA: RagB/SusD family nutrient uptake outer membrane protein [Bacteroidales bacterium]|nr:RagB/SusD family nutrient uptake outer membrane protein [Bacteroidales bacterium]
MKKILYPFLILALIIGFVGCSEDDLETAPTDSVTGPVLFATVDGAQVAMDGIYRMLFTSGWTESNTHQNFGIMSTKMYTSLMGEDFLQDAQGNGWFYFDYRFDVNSRYTSSGWRPYATWNFYYTLISNANYIIAEEEQLAESGDPIMVDNIMAQALTMRAYAYFQLIQSYQHTYKGNESAPGVPLYTEPTTAASEGKGRGTVEDVYTQINADLTDAIAKFSGNKGLQAHKSHFDYYIANAIKANVALVQNQFGPAASYASEALSKPGLTLTQRGDLTSGFNNRNMSGVMWGSEIIADQSGIYASFFAHMDARADRYARSSRKCIYNWLYDQISNQDLRKAWWQDPNAPDAGTSNHNIAYNQHKFLYSDIDTDLGDYIYMRAEEMQLVLAEALCHEGKFTEAKDKLEELLKLRYPADYDWAANSPIKDATMSKDFTMGSIGSAKTLMDHILLQRRIELWGEAERIFDIQRLKMGFDRTAPNSNHSQPNVGFDTTQPESNNFILAIPQKEFDGNPNMGPADQNPINK